MFKKLSFLKSYYLVFIAAVFAFQATILITTYTDLAKYFKNANYDPQEYNQTLVIMTILVDGLSLLFALLFFGNYLIQLLSFTRITCFATENKWIRASLLIIMIPISFLYANDVMAMLLYSWGAPAFKMT